MILRKIKLTFLLVYFLGAAISAQDQVLMKIDTADLKKHLSFIASDEMYGRKLGTEVDGLGKTADYLAENAKRIGLKPGSENYFQKVGMISSKPDKSSYIEIVNAKGNSVYRSNDIIKMSRTIEEIDLVNEEIIVAGFGMTGEEFNDLENINVEGKVVVISMGSPESFEKGDVYRWNNRLERRKIEAISENGARAIIIVTSPNDKEKKTYNQISVWFGRERYSLKQAEEEEGTEVFITLSDFADELLGGKGKYLKYLETVAGSKKPDSYLTENKKLNLTFISQITELDAKNVIGVVEGSDPELKDECVVFMAHYDHLGIGEDGDVYNGADDNGSGTVAIMEVAEAFASLEKKPKRSIVFLWVTCEELGLLGSGYYAENPVFPLEKTVACINLDMVGRVFEPRDTVWNQSPKKVKDFDGLYTLSNKVWPELTEINKANCEKVGIVPDTSLPDNFLRSSDHYNFHKNGVPILNYATGYHADYHKVGDEVSKINFSKIKRVADLCFLVGYEIADCDKIEFESATH